MASIITDPNGRKRIQFINGNGQRKQIRLGRATMKQAQEVKLRVEYLVLGQHDPDTSRWVEKCTDRLHEKLANVGLVRPRESTVLGPFLENYLQSRRGDLKSSSLSKLALTRTKLLEFFDANTPLRFITPDDASRWRQQLRSGGKDGKGKISEASVKHQIGNAKGFFSEARRRGLISQSPFEHLSGGATAAQNDRYVTPEEADAIIAACPDSRIALIFALARYAGLRMASETHLLTWNDVDWGRARLNVRSPKTEHHPGHERRWVPIVPKLMKMLEVAFVGASEGQDRIVTLRPGGFLNRMMKSYIKRAEIEVWPRLWQTLRSSCEKEWAISIPQFAVSKWIGHSITVSGKHYANSVPDELFERVSKPPASETPAEETESEEVTKKEARDGAKQPEMVPNENSENLIFQQESTLPLTVQFGARGCDRWPHDKDHRLRRGLPRQRGPQDHRALGPVEAAGNLVP
jgi:integrase